MKLGLVEGWRNAWRWASIRFGAILSIAIAYLAAAPDVALNALNAMPPEIRAYISPMIGMVLFGLVVATRLIHKPRNPDGDA